MDIPSLCGWPLTGSKEDGPKPPHVTLVQERTGVDGSFLLAVLLTNHLKSSRDNHVVLFTTHQNASHYAAACQKLTFNTSSALQSKHLCIVDMLSEMYNAPSDMSGPFMLQFVRQRLSELPLENTLVIVDDLTFYGVMQPADSDNALVGFAEDLVAHCQLQPSASLILKVNVAECYDRLCAHLTDMADTIVTLEPLPSGSYNECDGILTVHQKCPYPVLSALCEQPKTVLFKVQDRNVHTFRRGEAGIKNL
uniref:Elongator complex protein 6 n=1 Tax=Anopheles farauti TaxID=69004 RepID=A0A182QN34_9DIPT